jgi:hypothetical protein
MKVRYNPAVGIVLLVLGAVCLFLGLWLMALGELNGAVFAGLLVTVLGILYLVRPYFWVMPSTVEVVATVGPAKRRYPFQTLAVEGGKLYAVSEDGTRKKIPVARWMANSADWAAVTEHATRP